MDTVGFFVVADRFGDGHCRADQHDSSHGIEALCGEACLQEVDTPGHHARGDRELQIGKVGPGLGRFVDICVNGFVPLDLGVRKLFAGFFQPLQRHVGTGFEWLAMSGLGQTLALTYTDFAQANPNLWSAVY